MATLTPTILKAAVTGVDKAKLAYFREFDMVDGKPICEVVLGCGEHEPQRFEVADLERFEQAARALGFTRVPSPADAQHDAEQWDNDCPECGAYKVDGVRVCGCEDPAPTPEETRRREIEQLRSRWPRPAIHQRGVKYGPLKYPDVCDECGGRVENGVCVSSYH